MKAFVIFSLMGSLLAGCISIGNHRHPEGHVAAKRNAKIADLAGIYNEMSESTDGQKRSLSDVLSLHHDATSIDSLRISASPPSDLTCEAMQNSISISKKTMREGADYILSGSKLRLSSGKGEAGGFFSSGNQKWISYLYLTKAGDLALETDTTFTGSFLIFPAYSTQKIVYIWKNQKNK